MFVCFGSSEIKSLMNSLKGVCNARLIWNARRYYDVKMAI